MGTFFVVAFLSISSFNVDAVRAGAAAPVPRHGFDGCSGERWWTEVDLHVINKRQVLPDKSGVSGNDDGFGLYVYIFLRARDQGRFWGGRVDEKRGGKGGRATAVTKTRAKAVDIILPRPGAESPTFLSLSRGLFLLLSPSASLFLLRVAVELSMASGDWDARSLALRYIETETEDSER